jgi:hypothetical protein
MLRIQVCLLAALLASINGVGVSSAAESTPEAAALPFPLDAQELEFVAWAGDINYSSPSPLNSLAAFYLREMAARGWKHDESAVEIDDDSIELTFNQGQAVVEVDLSQRSQGVQVRIDCKNVEFTDTDNPAKLAAAGVPVPRATVILQQAIALPADIQGLQYDADGCTFKSPQKLQQAFDHFSGLVKGQGYRESRRPIVTDTRRYTEFAKGPTEISVNVFTDPVGSRVVLEYEDSRKVAAPGPLAAVASLPIRNPAKPGDPDPAEPAKPVVKTPIDVVANKGSATVVYGGKKYVFPHVASFQSKGRGDYATMVVFSAKPIPYHKLQSLAYTEDDFGFSDLYEFSSPEYFILQLGKYQSFSFSVNGVGIGGHDIEGGVDKMAIEEGRVKGTMSMPPQEILSRNLSFTASIDAGIITPLTRFAGPQDAVETPNHPLMTDSPVPMPPGAEDISREGSRYRKTYRAVAALPEIDVAGFYRKELLANGWKRAEDDTAGGEMHFSNASMNLAIRLTRRDDKTAIEVVARDAGLARREGVLPEPGKGRLVLANARGDAVVYTIGKTNYPLPAGRGAKDFKSALNYSIPPGRYDIVVKIPGQQPKSEAINLTTDSCWAIIALPTGGYLPLRLY